MLQDAYNPSFKTLMKCGSEQLPHEKKGLKLLDSFRLHVGKPY